MTGNITMPLVSVVIPLYQTERFISAAIGSVLAQSFTDFEVLVVDDGSRDQGPSIAASFGDPRVRVITQANRGLAGARNTGIRNARGTFVALLDADDLWHPKKLELHVAQLVQNPQIGVSFSVSRLVDEDGRDIGLLQRPLSMTFDASHVFCRNPIGNGSVPVLRKAAFDDIAFFDKDLGRTCWFDESFRQTEDVECWTRIIATTHWQFGFIDQTLTDYRVNKQGLSANVAAQLATWRRFRAKVAGYAPELEARCGKRAESYQLRYLARRAVRSGESATALRLICETLKLYPMILREEPMRTVSTLIAAAIRSMLPGSLFDRVEKAAIKVAKAVPGLRI